MIVKNSSEIVAAKNANILKPIDKHILSNIPITFKDNDNMWVNISYRIRAIYVQKDITDIPLNYADLADPKYKNRICIRPLTDIYNMDLFGYLYEEMGYENFIIWFDKFKSNLALIPSGNDRSQAKNIYEGKCDIALINTYYYGLMKSDPTQHKWAENVIVILPDQQKKGAVAMKSAIGLLSDSSESVDFLKFILSDEVQATMSNENFEFAINMKNNSEFLKAFGSHQKIKLENIKLKHNIQNDLFNIRKEIYPIIKQ